MQFVWPITSEGKLRWLHATAIYLVCNFFHIASWNAKFWDQWVLYQDLASMPETERQCDIYRCKVPFSYVWELPLLEIGVWALRLALIFVILATGWAFHELLVRCQSLPAYQVSFATLLYLMLPVFGARLGLSTARYSVLLLLLLVGGLLLTSRSWLVNCLGLVFITYAEFQPSHQIFALSFVLLLLMRDFKTRTHPSKKTFSISLILLILPFLHRLLLADLVVTLGILGPDNGYNSIEIAFLVRAVLVAGVLCLPLVTQLLRSRKPTSSSGWSKVSLTSVSLLILALGTFPYMAVGHFANISDWILPWLPDESDWSSRHQVLQAFGFSLLVTAGIGKVRDEYSRLAFSLSLLVCLTFSSSTFANYYLDSLKQRDFITQIREKSEELTGITQFRVVDEALDMNARSRGIRDYEWESMLAEALGRPVEILEEGSIMAIGCNGTVVGKNVTLTKVSGRLRVLLTRSRGVSVQITNLVSCT